MSFHGMNRLTYNRHLQKNPHYDIVRLGYKYNMTDIEAAIGRNPTQTLSFSAPPKTNSLRSLSKTPLFGAMDPDSSSADSS